MTERADIITTKKENPNLDIFIDGGDGKPKSPAHLPGSLVGVYDRLKKAALDYTAGLPCSDAKTFLRLVWQDISLDENNPEIIIEVWVKAAAPRPGKLWRYVGDIAYARNFRTENDNIFETREIVDAPTKTDRRHTEMRIFGEFKSVKCALKDLLERGNYSHDGRRGRKL